jgi:hypothetical protein
MPNLIESCTAEPDTIPADNNSASTITAVVHDDSGQTVSFATVNWSVSSGGLLTSTTTLTNANGEATNSLTASTAGSLTVTATTPDDTSGKSATVTSEEVGMNIVDEVESYPGAIPIDGSVVATLFAKVLDENEQPAIGVEVEWTLEPADKGEIAPQKSVTDDEGNAVTKLTAKASGVLVVKAKTAEQETAASKSIIASSPLFVPHVQNASENDNFTLDSHDIDFGVSLTVPPYSNAKVGDNVTVYWGEYSIEFPIANPDTDLPKIIDVVEAMDPGVLTDGVHSVYYIVSDNAGNLTCSSGLNITVSNGGHTSETLDAPFIAEVANDPYINILDASDGVDVEIKYSGMAEGDFITLYWPALDDNGNQYSPGSVTVPYTLGAGESSWKLKLDAEYFIVNDQGYEGTVDAYYTVLSASTGELALSHKKHCIIDTVGA